MFVKFLLFLFMSLQPIGATETPIDIEISNKQQIIQELTIEIEEAKELGIAETMDIVEKIGYLRKLQEELAELEAQ